MSGPNGDKGMLPVPYDVNDSLTPSGRVMISCYIRISSCQVTPPSICAPAGEGEEGEGGDTGRVIMCKSFRSSAWEKPMLRMGRNHLQVVVGLRIPSGGDGAFRP